MQLTIFSDDGNHLRMKLKGRVTQKDLPADDLFAAELGPTGYSRKVLLDMQDAEFLDSSGVSWLLVSHKRFREKGGQLVLHSIPPLVGNVLKVLKMNQIFSIADTEQGAVRLVQGDAE